MMQVVMPMSATPEREAGQTLTMIAGQIRWILLLGVVFIFSILNPDFRSHANLEGFLQSLGVLLILAMGESFVLLVAGIDLSVGAVVATGSVLLASLLTAGCPLLVAVPVTLVAGLAIGLANGALTLLLGVPSFIVTFGSLGVCSSIGLLVSGGDRIALPSQSALPLLASGEVAGIPYQIVLTVGLLAAGTLFLNLAPTGRHLFAVGGNREAARLSGISTVRVSLCAFGLSGLFASIAAVVYSARIVSGNPVGGVGLNLEAIAAAVIGGVSLFGGRGSLVGACFGAILYSLIENVLGIYNVNPNVTEIAGGLIIVTAGLVNVLTDRKAGAA